MTFAPYIHAYKQFAHTCTAYVGLAQAHPNYILYNVMYYPLHKVQHKKGVDLLLQYVIVIFNYSLPSLLCSGLSNHSAAYVLKYM